MENLKNIYFQKKDGTFYMDETKEEIYKKLDNFNIEQVKQYLKIFDIPWMPDEWEKYLRKFPNKPIFGRYLALCKLFGYKNFSYTDSEWMRDMRETKYFEALRRQLHYD